MSTEAYKVLAVATVFVVAIGGCTIYNVAEKRYETEKIKIQAEAELNKERVKAGMPAVNSEDSHSTYDFNLGFGGKKDK